MSIIIVIALLVLLPGAIVNALRVVGFAFEVGWFVMSAAMTVLVLFIGGVAVLLARLQ